MADTWGNPRAGDTPGFGTGGGGSVGGGGGYGVDRGGGLASPSGPSGWESQGRGSNVTNTRPQSPAESAGGGGPGAPTYFGSPSIIQGGGAGQIYFPATGGQMPTVGVPQVNIPFFAGVGSYTVSPQSLGMPSILLNQFSSKATNAYIPQVPGPIRSQAYTTPTINVTPTDSGVPFFGSEQGMGQTNVRPLDLGPSYGSSFEKYSDPQATKDYISKLETEGKVPPNTILKLYGAESGYGNAKNAFNLSSGPSGPFQFDATTGAKYGLVGEGFDYRLDFEKSAQAAAKYAKDISNSLAPTLGRQPTAGEIGLGYNQGIAGAKALLSNPNASAAEALAPAYKGNIDAARRAIINNGGDPDAPASQFTGKMTSYYQGQTTEPKTLLAGLSDVFTGVGQTTADLAKAALSAPATFADTLESLLVTPAQAKEVPFPTPVTRSFKEAGSINGGADIPASRTYTLDTMPNRGIQEAGLRPALFYSDAVNSPENTTAANADAAQGGQQTAAQAASSSPQTFGDWLGSLFDTSGRIKELEAQGRTSTYLTFGNNNPDADWTAADAKQWYADQYTGGDVSKVRSRIVDFGQGPVVDYYAKDLGEKIFGDLGQGIASLFGGKSESSNDTNLSDDEYFRRYGRKRGD